MEDMCTYGESVYYSLKRDFEKECRAEGIVETTLSHIRKLMKSTGWSAQETMNQLEVSEEEQVKYAELLKEQ